MHILMVIQTEATYDDNLNFALLCLKQLPDSNVKGPTYSTCNKMVLFNHVIYISFDIFFTLKQSIKIYYNAVTKVNVGQICPLSIMTLSD